MTNFLNPISDFLLGERHANIRKQKINFSEAVNSLVNINNYEIRCVPSNGEWFQALKLEDCKSFNSAGLFAFPGMGCEAFIVVTYFRSEIIVNKFMRENGFDLLNIDKKYFYENLDYLFTGGNSKVLIRPNQISEDILSLTYKLKVSQKMYLQNFNL